MLWSLITFLALGLFSGWIARLLVPGDDPMKLHQTLALGVVGSFFGGLMAKIFFDVGNSILQPSNVLGSVLGAVIVLMIYNLFEGEKSERKKNS